MHDAVCANAAVCLHMRVVVFRGSRLHEAAAAGCAVVTGNCTAVMMEVADLNQAALRADEEWDLRADPASTDPTQDSTRCENPTPRRAAG